MPRRTNTRPSAASAASAASTAAAANSATPTFTSFAAATAHALGSYDAVTTLSTQWDDDMINILKKFSKRDPTTKLRALKDLSSHLQTLPNEPDTKPGTAFLSAWATTFPSLVLNEATPTVRAAGLSFMFDVVIRFGRQTQPILAQILPAWAAATGDVVPLVSSTATTTLNDAFPSPERRQKVATRYAPQLRAFCSHLLSGLNQSSARDSFEPQALRVIAVLQWTLGAIDHLSAISTIIDDANDPFRLLIRGPKPTRKQQRPSVVSRAVADFAMNVLRRTVRIDKEGGASNESDVSGTGNNEQQSVTSDRLERIANLAVTLAKNADPAAWDMFIVFLKEAPDAIAPVTDKLTQAVEKAVTTISPAALSALLPLVDAMNPSEGAPAFAKKVLLAMWSLLLPKDDSAPKVAYVIAALPAYVETIAFVHEVALKRWFQGRVDDGEQFVLNWFDEFILPTCNSIISGNLPAVPSSHNGKEVPSSSRRTNGANVLPDVVVSVGRLIRQMSAPEAARAMPKLAEGLLDALAHCSTDDLLNRYGEVLKAIGDCERQGLFAKAVVLAAAERRDNTTLLNMLHVSALTLMAKAGYWIIQLDTDEMSGDEIVDHALSFVDFALTCIDADGISTSDSESIVKHAGVILSWAIWAASSVNKGDVFELVLCRLRDRQTPELFFTVLSEILSAHKARMASENFPDCVLLSGDGLERVVREATANLLECDPSLACIRLLSHSCGANSGAVISLDTIGQIVTAASSLMRSKPSDKCLDSLLISLLNSSAEQIEFTANFVELTSGCFRRAAHSEEVLSALSSCLLSLGSSNVGTHVENLIKDFHDDVISSRKSEDTADLGRALAHIASIPSLILPHISPAFDKLLSWSPPKFTRSFLLHVSFGVVFGEGSFGDVRVEYMLQALESVYSVNSTDLLSRVSAFFENIDDSTFSYIATTTTSFALREDNQVAMDVMKLVCESSRCHTEDCEPLKQVAKEIYPVLFYDEGDDLGEFYAIPPLIELCIRSSDGRFINCLKDILTNVTKIVRSEPGSSMGMTALDIMSSALANGINPHMGDNDTAMGSQYSWLTDLLEITLRAIRRRLEQPRGMTKPEIEELETHCACFVYHCMNIPGVECFNSDDVRFWTLRTRDAVEKFVKRADSEKDFVTPSVRDRMAWRCKLARKIVDREVEAENPVKVELADEMCHWGAWASVFVILGLTDVHFKVERCNFVFEKIDAGSCGWLIVAAGERGVLLGKDGGFPVKRGTIYGLLPILGCPSSRIRKAVLTLCAHAAAVDLPEAVVNEFPIGGFSNEAEEEGFATDMIPKEMRKGLQWPEALDENRTNHSVEATGLEIGYFLTWRLFLDLVQSSDGSGNPDDNGGEEISFRRVEVTFLRENSDLFSEFFKRCVDVVVDGSAVERKAAGIGAENAMQSEEREAQGIELAREPSEEAGDKNVVLVEKNEEEDENDIQVEVGRAAGIAFSRALQRLPALSRQHMDKYIDRGTWDQIEKFVRKRISPLLIAAEVRKVREWGMFGGGNAAGASSSSSAPADDNQSELVARGSIAGGEVWATYTFSDVTLEIGMRLPDVFPMRTAVVEARTRVGMTEARWRQTLLGITKLLQIKDGTLAEAIELWGRNLDKTFQGAEECPICYSVLHLTTSALPTMKCRTCHNLFHSDCLCRWFTKSNSSACPLCRSAF